jgi:peptide/nickel transport system permease protein
MSMDRRRGLAVIIAAIVIIVIVVAFILVRFKPDSIDNNWIGLPIPPCFLDAAKCYGHVLGSDDIGRDILARLMFGGMVSFGATLLAVVVEVMLGVGMATSARRGGPIVRFVVQRFETALSCFPPWAFVLTMIAIGTPPNAETVSIFGLAAFGGLVFSPQIARVAGSVREPRILLPTVLNQAAYDFTRLVALLATVDFIGLGVQEPTPSLGNMMQHSMEDITIAWWAVVFPAVAIIGAVFVIEILRRLLFDGVTRAGDQHFPTLT